MSDNKNNNQDEYRGGEEQPWREQRNQPEPLAIEGHHAGRHVAEEKQRPTRDDSGVGDESTIDGGGGGSRHTEDEGLSSGANFGTSGSHQGQETTPYGRSSTRHSTGHGRNTEGAFGEEQSSSNANPLSDYRDAGIAEREIGPAETDERTTGGSW